MSSRAPFGSALERARGFAALSGPFDPVDALKASGTPGSSDGTAGSVGVASQLSLECDTRVEGKHWLMRGSERRWTIQELADSHRLADALAWRVEQEPFDQAARDVVAALRGTGAFAAAALESLVSVAGDALESKREELARASHALEWVGPTSPSHSYMDLIRAALNRSDDRRRSETLLSRGFDGREEQRTKLSNWLAGPTGETPVRALFVTGLPGIGKSALLEDAIRGVEAEGRQAIVIRLDFDRPTLDVLDQVGLTLEFARQLSAQIPKEAAAVRGLRLNASIGIEQSLKGSGRHELPSDLVSAMGAALRQANRWVVLALDTCEVLRGRGETHPVELFVWIDSLVRMGVEPMVVVAAGRGDAFDRIPERIERVALDELSPEAAERLLERAAVPAAVRPQMVALAKGNPLLLKLASTAASAAKKISAPHLYRFLLSRISDTDLRRLADPGLLVRRISAEVIRSVLAPTLGMRRIDEARAKRLFAELETQNWLLEADPTAPGWLRQRPDMRAELLPLLYRSKPARCRKIDRAAAEWFGKGSERWMAVESLYHRLQLTRSGGRTPQIDPDLARHFDDSTLAELPPRARDAVLHARGDSSTLARAPARRRRSATAAPDRRAVKDLQFAIERGDWIEAADVYARAFDDREIDPLSEAGAAVRTLFWRTGRWIEARRMLGAHDASARGDETLEGMRPDDALAQVEMRAEFGFRAVVRRLVGDPSWRSAVERTVARGAKTEMTAGALGFALLASDVDIRASWRRVDLVGATEDLWRRHRSGADLARAIAVADKMRERREGGRSRARPLDAFPDRAAKDGAVAARRLAAHSPYALPLALIAHLDQRHRVATHAEDSVAALRRSKLWWNAGIAGIKTTSFGSPREPIELFRDVGLVGEWAGAAGFALGGANLALVAKGAERWRRTVAGRWSYDAKPRGWSRAQFAEPLDASTWARVHELLESSDPVEASRSLLAAWVGDHEGALTSRVRKRLTELMSRARSAQTKRGRAARAIAAADRLMRAGAPSALVPALATLVAFKQKP